MSDKTELKTTEVETPKQGLIPRVFAAARTKTGKTVLTVAGTAGALVATYVLGFRQGQTNVIEVLEEISDDPEEIEASDEEATTFVILEEVESQDSDKE